MNIRKIINDDNAVSPVIGVILMVAITVILAAVIATFVLGLGDQVSNTAPQASFSFNYDSSGGGGDEGALTVTHDGGDSISESELYLRGSGLDDTGNWNDLLESTASGSNSEVVAGDSAKSDVDSRSYEANVVYQSEQGGNSATLSTDSGPDA